ncbi:MAG: hypothetical protein EOO38_29350 [Cytophagaceae bacterium]|nr:MAG: hypothetical protein EOO38_29350 [Cytophagaceae bacterium]
MDKKTVSEGLRALALDSQNRSKAALLRDVIDDVETALAAGVTRAAVLAELNTHGLDMSLATFETTLKRLRAKRRYATSNTLQTPAHIEVSNKVAPAVPAPPGSIEPGGASHNPADIDRILRTRPDLDALSKHAKRNLK